MHTARKCGWLDACFLRQTGSRHTIIEVCEFRFWQFRHYSGHIFPRKNANYGRFEIAFNRPEFDRTQQCVVCQMHLAVYLITLVSVCPCVCVCVCVCVCASVHRSVVERLHSQFFTDFHQILRAAQKYGCFERYCFWNKQEVVYRF